MRSETRLDSVVFQLTPTRTRFDLVIISNNKKEKLASGLLSPFLAHLKTAQDQIDKGGYSIILEPDPQVGAAWFTKLTVERFVRFVSQPEVLERVTTIESEILQIENAIAIQGNDNFGLRTVADQPIKPVESTRGVKTSVGIDAEKAIVLYKPGSQPNLPESNGSITQENSKVQLLRVLETRKMILRKEQGMAFARTEAAGFDMDKLVDLISFAESFGASRLKEACIGLRELWKKKHDTGQWFEVEAAAAMSIQPEFSTLNASGIVFAADAMTQKDYVDPRSLSGGDMVLDIDGKSDKHLPEDAQVPVGHQEHFHGQFQHPTYPQWPLPPPPGHPGFQSYTVQGMPCYQNYPGNIPYFHPPYHSAEDSRLSNSHRKGSKRQSMDDKHTDTRGRSTRSHNDTDQNTSDSDKDGSHGHKSHRRVVKSGNKKSNIVITANLNDISSKKHGVGQSESESQSTSESEAEDLQSDMQESKHKHFAETSKKEVGQIKTAQYSDAYSNDKVADGEETDSGNWQAFQKFLLRAEEKSRRVEESMFAGGKEPPRRNQIRDEADMTCPTECGDSCDRTMRFDLANGKATRMKQVAFEDPSLVSHNGRVSVDHHFKEIEKKGVYRRMSNDEFLVNGKEKQLNSMRYSGAYTDHAYVHNAITLKNSLNDMPDESFVLPHRSVSRDIGSDITAIHMDSEFSLSFSKAQESSNKIKSQISYEPEDVSLVTERGREMVSVPHHPATDFDIRIPVRNSVKLQVPNPENPLINPKIKKSDKDNFKASKDSVEKMRKDALSKNRSSSSRLNPLTEAQKRAEKLRSYKADLQKVKREREEEEKKRLEALKRERQKRIAARSNAATTKLPLTAQQTKARSLTKTLPNPYKSSKFSDSDPVNSSLLHKFPIRTSSTGAIVSQKATKPSRLNGSKHGITRSTSSLPVSRKQGLMAEARADSLRMKRLSDPKSSYNQHPSLVKANRFRKQSSPDESQKKITAIMQLDKRKTATLPELKIQTPKTSDRIGKESTSKGSMQKGTGSKPPQTFGCSKEKLSSDNQPSNSDENLVIEKTVVMLENNVVTALVASQGGKMLDTKERSHGNESDRRRTMIHPPPSSLVSAKLEGAGKLDGKLSSFEVVSRSRNEPQKFSKLTEPEKSYQVPYARGTSLDDPVGTHLGYDGGKKTVQESVTSFEKLTLGNHLETCEEPVSQEKKGFIKLLKFGRKRHNLLGESTDGLDVSSVDEQTVATGSPNAGNLLKNLISQDGNHTGSTPSKASRSFSLLSPFRSKSSDKKPAEP
ncbi:COP1-interacting protein 7-like [Zingiber officinale]|uniref:COP1-interacting protein 7-like n=1 Tax=Zingiber officinale TaxID=94328 RepID=UPI001C4D7EB4|nr:COP1-interacting protein 7-like [Zingiber officinale]